MCPRQRRESNCEKNTPYQDRDVLMATLKPHLQTLQKFALKLTRNPHDSEDLVQDVVLKLLEHRNGSKGLLNPNPG